MYTDEYVDSLETKHYRTIREALADGMNVGTFGGMDRNSFKGPNIFWWRTFGDIVEHKSYDNDNDSWEPLPVSMIDHQFSFGVVGKNAETKMHVKLAGDMTDFFITCFGRRPQNKTTIFRRKR